MQKTESYNGVTYEYVQELGSGTYGTTWMAFADGKKVAIKIFSRPGKLGQFEIDDIKEDWEIEINALKQMLPKCCPHAVCIKDYWFENGAAKIVMDFVRGETLSRHMLGSKKIPLRKRTHLLLKQLVAGIDVIHSQGIVHQDIKGDNIMFDYDLNDGQYRYIDFGLSCIAKGCSIQKEWPCGSIGTRYTAPEEIVKLRNKKAIIDRKVLEAHDYWSVGVVLLRWYTFDGSRKYYSSIVQGYAKTAKGVEKLANEANCYSVFPYYFKFPDQMLLDEISKIKEPAARAIVGLLLEKDPVTRWHNFKTVKYIIDPKAPLVKGTGHKGTGKWGDIKQSILKLRL